MGDDGVRLPTISSNSPLSSADPMGKGLHAGDPAVKLLPILQLHMKNEPLICGKLCETVRRSTTGHVFELSSTKENDPFLEYNSLHDPHLKSYFYQSQMKEKLVKNRFVTNDLYVICRSVKEYNAYNNFLESEFKKLHMAKEDERKKRESQEKSIQANAMRRRQSTMEREERRKQFFKEQEKKLRSKEVRFRRREKQEHMAKMKRLEERQIQRERDEIRRETEREQRKLRLLKRAYEEASRRQSLLQQCEAEEKKRQIHLSQMRKEEKMRHYNELERRWQMYEEHAQKVKEEHEAKMAKEREERERRIRKREKIFQTMRKKEEERHAKLHEENYHHAEQLKEQADQMEKKWQRMKENEVGRWKETIQKKREQWDLFMAQQKEALKKELEKHKEELLKQTRRSSVMTPSSWAQRKSGSSRSASESREQSRTRSNSVRFTTKPTVHIIKDLLSEESSAVTRTSNDDSQLNVTEEDHNTSLKDGDRERKTSEEQALEAELLDLDHRDSYDIQVEKRKDSVVTSKMEEECEVEEVEEKSSMDLSRVLEETGCVDANKTSPDADSVSDQAEGEATLAAGDSASTLLSQQRSVASDMVDKVLERAVEKSSDLQIVDADTSP